MQDELVQTSFLDAGANTSCPHGSPAPPPYGSTGDQGFIPAFDAERLQGQMHDVHDLMRDKQFRTLTEIQKAIGRGAETGISAALRSFRKAQYGRHIVNKQRRGDPKHGLFEYQLICKER